MEQQLSIMPRKVVECKITNLYQMMKEGQAHSNYKNSRMRIQYQKSEESTSSNMNHRLTKSLNRSMLRNATLGQEDQYQSSPKQRLLRRRFQQQNLQTKKSSSKLVLLDNGQQGTTAQALVSNAKTAVAVHNN